ncbi:MAG: TonB-dependent receptor, partial [Bacteroidales bacterium]
MRKLITCIIMLLSVLSIRAQNKYTISGYIRDAKTGEELIGAGISVKELPSVGATTNSYGFYSLTLSQGKYTVTVHIIGYEFLTRQLNLPGKTAQNFDLTENITQLNEVTVASEKRNDNVTKNQMSIEKLNIQEVNNLPSFFGERDVLKTLQLLPGIKPAGEGNSGFNVRGGTPDQNLILLDGATVYNASHLMGFFSVFNPDAIKDVTIYKGSLPAEFGGRLSSVL